MSPVFSCAMLLLVLLASCQSSCSARPRGLDDTAEIVQDGNSSQKSNLTSNKKMKNGHKISITGTSGHQKASKVVQKVNGSKDNMEVREMAIKSDKTRSTTHSSGKRNNNHQPKFLSETGGRGTKVTYRVPQRKRGEKQPGFNLDYSPPKVHPPHHN